MRRIFWGVGVALAAAAGVAILEVGGAFFRPPQPLSLGTVQWNYETGFSVESVRRTRQAFVGGVLRRAHGEFYVVNVAVLCPFGERYRFDGRTIRVELFGGSGGSWRRGWWAPLNPGPPHEVLGASEHHALVFDLPRDAEQPGLVFSDANDPWHILDLLLGSTWQPHRFNLRYD